MSVFFERLSELCHENKTSPNAVARKLSISSGSITAWKKGSYPRTETLQRLADYFKVSSDYLMGKVDEPNRASSSANVSAEPQGKGEIVDPDIRMIQRAKERMSEKEWKRQMIIIEASFGKYFSDDYVDDDSDE
jgi:transcriptional regulator with XRE-family HTH domain